jgi:hypothetical protein
MIKKFTSTLLENIPSDFKKQKINLILDSGAFNGSYLVGALYFLKEMERKKHIKINKISGSSIGSLTALLYCSDLLDLSTEIYNIASKQFKENWDLNVVDEIFQLIRRQLNPDYKIPDRFLYISFYNIKKGKKVVRSRYRNLEDLFETIRRSCFVPFLINGEMLHREKFCDGMFPYILPIEPNVETLYLNLYGYDKLQYLLSIKNEKNNTHRILNGLLDIHLFFIKDEPTQMCSYREKWTLCQWFYYSVLRWLIEFILIRIICCIHYYST